MVKNEKIEGSLFSQTFQIEVNQVPTLFSFWTEIFVLYSRDMDIFFTSEELVILFQMNISQSQMNKGRELCLLKLLKLKEKKECSHFIHFGPF